MTTSTAWPDAAHPPSKLDDRSDSSPAVPGSHASDHTDERQRINALIDKVTALLDGSITLPGAGGGSGTKPFLVAASDAPAAWRTAANYLCDGTGDQVEINAALLAAVNSGKGGKVELSPGTFNVAANSPIKLQGRVLLQGSGSSTRIVPQGTWSSTVDSHPSAVMRMIWNSGVGSSSDVAYGDLWGVSDLRIDGDQRADPTVGSPVKAACSGIYIRLQTNATFWPTAAGNKDSHGRMTNLWLGNLGNHGIHGYAYSVDNADPDIAWQRIGSTHASDIDIIDCNGIGVYIEAGWVDSFWQNVNVGSPGSYAFYVGDNDHYFSNCKGWYAVNETWYLAANHSSLVGCHSQNGDKHSFHIQGNGNTLAGCGADADGQSSGTWAGYYIVGKGNTVAGCAAVNDTSPGWLDYGFWHAGDHNVISGTWHSNGHGTAATNGTVADNSVTVKSY